MRFVEFCAGVGGTRAGLEAIGWQCVHGLDHDPDVVEVHRKAFGQIELNDVASLRGSDVPSSDVWVAGFPCQPFSSSGNRSGFLHQSGNVFEQLIRLAETERPNVLLFENVVGLLSNKSGHTFASVLNLLTNLGFMVQWVVIDTSWFGIPQTRARLFIVAYEPGALAPSEIRFSQADFFGGVKVESVFAPLFDDFCLEIEPFAQGNIDETLALTEPRVGKPKVNKRHFASFGIARENAFTTYNIFPKSLPNIGNSMAEVAAPDFPHPEKVRSARFWSEKGGGGANGIHVRDSAYAHCVGTSLGGAPLFAVPLELTKNDARRKELLRFADWSREQQDLFVFRLSPSRTVRLFGPYTETIEASIHAWEAGTTRKFKLVGNMVAPAVAESVARTLQASFHVRKRPKSDSRSIV